MKFNHEIVTNYTIITFQVLNMALASKVFECHFSCTSHSMSMDLH